VMASLEYAVEHLHVPLIVILGHKRCGAIEAVCQAEDKPLHDHLRELQKHMTGIHQKVLETHGKHTPELLDTLCHENAKQQALTLLKESPFVKTAVDRGSSRVMYAVYDMHSGTVDFFELD